MAASRRAGIETETVTLPPRGVALGSSVLWLEARAIRSLPRHNRTEIAHRLRTEQADDPMMHVSHETVYRSLFVEGCGELPRELFRCPRPGRAKRRPGRRPDNWGQLPDKVMINDVPAEDGPPCWQTPAEGAGSARSTTAVAAVPHATA